MSGFPDTRPVMRTWRGVLRRPELRGLAREIAGSAWIFDAIDRPLVIASGRIQLPRHRALRPLRAFADVGMLEGVACTDAQMHSDEHIQGWRWAVMGLVQCPGGQARVSAVLDDLTVETAAVDVGDVFVLDVRRAHAAHVADPLRRGLGLMTFWSAALPGVEAREEAEAVADRVVRFIGEARRG